MNIMAKKDKSDVSNEPADATAEVNVSVEQTAPPEDVLGTIFNAAVAEGKDKNAIILALSNQLNGNITQAVREYTRLVRENGLVMAPKERTAKIEQMLADKHADLLDTDKRSELATVIADEFDISTATAMQHIRDICNAKGIEIPSISRTSLEDLTKFVKDALDAGTERADIIKNLSATFGYTENSAASALSRATKELGLSAGRLGPKVPMAELVSLIRENLNKGKKEAIKIVATATGYSESTIGAYYQYLPFAEEWSKQESLAAMDEHNIV